MKTELQGGDQDSVESLVKHLINRVEESERRYSNALEDLHSRLDQLSQATRDAKSASGSDDEETLDRLHEQVSSLAKRLSDTEAAGSSASSDSDVFSRLARGSEPFSDISETSGQPTDTEMPAGEPASSFGSEYSPESQYSAERMDFGAEEETPLFGGQDEPETPDVTLPPLVPDEEAPTSPYESGTSYGSQSFESAPSFETGSDFGRADKSAAAAAMAAPQSYGEPVSDTDYARRLYDAAQRLEGSLGAIVPNDQIDSLNAKMDEIASQLDRALQRSEGEPPQPDAISNIEQQLTEIGQQLGRTETEIAKIGTIESQLTQLMEHIDTQPSMEDVAERAANTAAERVVSEVKSSAAERLEAIHADLTAMNERSSNTDDRLADTLSAVHDSLKKLVEHSEQSPAPTRRAPFADASMDEQAPFTPMHSGPMERPAPLEDRGPDLEADEPASDRSLRSQLSKVMPEDEDEAPGPFGKKTPEAKFEGEADEPRRPMAYQDKEDDGGNTDSFVAAARRAAQAAAAQAEQNSSWGDKKRAKALAGSSADQEDQPKSKKRSYLMFFAVILLIVSACLLYSRLSSKPEDTEGAAPAAEESAPAQDGQGSGDSGAAPSPNRSGYLDEPIESLAPHKPGDVDIGREAVPEPDLPGFKLPTLPPTPASIKRGTGADLPPGVSLTIFEKAEGEAAENNENVAERKVKYPIPPKGMGTYALRRAAAEGDPKAMYVVGLRYAEGDAGLRDMDAAVRWLRLAAAENLAPAQYRLGVLYERGEGVDFDLIQASAWYQRAAQLGNLKAMHNLAVIEGGKQGKGDYTDAAKWYTKAAKRGLSDSQFNLGVLKEHGLGTALDLTEAYKWFSLAAAGGDGEAAKRRDALRNQLTSDQLAKAEAAISAWRPAMVDAEANEVKAKESWVADAAEPTATLISKAQSLLNSLGYDAGPVDGQMGDRTRSAILDFERRNGLPETGAVSIPLVSRLEKLAS